METINNNREPNKESKESGNQGIMVKHYRRRCAVCGMVVFLDNLERSHSLDTFEYDIGGRGHLVVKKMGISNDQRITNYWIERLEEVLDDLKMKKG